MPLQKASTSQAVGREFESRCPLQIIQAFQLSGMEGLTIYMRSAMRSA